jgi:hypothetical protein
VLQPITRVHIDGLLELNSYKWCLKAVKCQLIALFYTFNDVATQKFVGHARWGLFLPCFTLLFYPSFLAKPSTQSPMPVQRYTALPKHFAVYHAP